MVVDVQYVDDLDANWAMVCGDDEAYFLVRRGCEVCPDMLREAWETFLHLAGYGVPES